MKNNLSLVEKLTKLIDKSTTRNQWHEIIALKNDYPLEETSKFLWAWPTINSIEYIQMEIVQRFKIENILSIGCGSGLLEKILQIVTGISINGLELDKSWWSSAYSPKSFIPLQFTDCAGTGQLTKQFLNQCFKNNNNNNISNKLNDERTGDDDRNRDHETDDDVNGDDQQNSNNQSSALLFCYFNNRPAFLEYVDRFNGNFIIIIGPELGHNIYTDPDPMEPKFNGDVDDDDFDEDNNKRTTSSKQYFKWNLISVYKIENSINIIAFYGKETCERSVGSGGDVSGKEIVN